MPFGHLSVSVLPDEPANGNRDSEEKMPHIPPSAGARFFHAIHDLSSAGWIIRSFLRQEACFLALINLGDLQYKVGSSNF